MKFLSPVYSNKLFYTALIIISLSIACGGSGDKTDMSNIPKFSDVTASANIDFSQIRSLGQIATFGDINNDNYPDFVAGKAVIER